MKRKLLFVCLAACLVASLPAQAPATATATAAPVKVAFLAVNNLGGDAQTEYLGGAIQGLLLFDLTRSPGVTLLDRNSLDRVLREQELQLSGLMDDAEGSRRFGQLLGADFLAWAEFVGLESEVMLTLRVVNVASGQSAAFRERGGDENAVHRAAESLALFLTGSRPNFAGASGERSIVRQLELAPGSLALHSILVRGEIYLDGEFAGYTTGSSEIPFIVDALPAGRHSLRVHLGSGFGVVTMPELSFGDWQTEFEVPSGGRVVLRDPTRDFNSQLLRLQVLLEETIVWSEANSGRFAQARELNFLDRAGNPVVVRLLLNPTNAAGGLSLAPSLEVGGQSLSLSLASRAGGLVELERTLGLVILRVSIDRRSNRYQITISLKRADIYPGMQDD